MSDQAVEGRVSDPSRRSQSPQLPTIVDVTLP